MSATSRELVYSALEFDNPARAPRQLWTLPWASDNYPQELRQIQADYPSDFGDVDPCLREPLKTEGDQFRKGRYVDEWGCVFENLAEGIIGEVKNPTVQNWDTDVEKIHIPREWFTMDIDAVNRNLEGSDKFTVLGCPRPFEQLQFIRGTEDLYIDLIDPPKSMLDFMKKMHDFYCEVMQLIAKTDVDALSFMDDWGSQRALLIRPALWREYFGPMYRDYIQIAHAAGKKAFMHSDGYMLEVLPDLVEMGLDAVNCQIFCMGIENLKPFAGKITFWGEIDRQHLLPNGTPADIDRAVREVYANLWSNGGCIAQCEFGPGAKPGNVRQVFKSWDEVSMK